MLDTPEARADYLALVERGGDAVEIGRAREIVRRAEVMRAQVAGDDCLCVRCVRERNSDCIPPRGSMVTFAFRYACEVCGNKRCPKHSDHRLECTGSNEPGQEGGVL